MLFESQFNDELFIKNNIDIALVNSKEALEKGNIFQNEYIPYKNYNYEKLSANTEQEELLLKIYESEFALIDLSLYLDLHPNDNNIYEVFKEYVKNYEEYKLEYENKYEQLDKCFINNNKYSWINNPWPWDNGGKYYV